MSGRAGIKEAQEQAAKPFVVWGRSPQDTPLLRQGPWWAGPAESTPSKQLGVQAGGRPDWAVMTLAGLTEGLPGGRGHGRKVSATTPTFQTWRQQCRR